MGVRILSALRVGFMEPWKPKNSSQYPHIVTHWKKAHW